ncbi:hypothetical protein BTO16_14890 [Polaribacter glomeratus]|uniref:Uncharacterized protein n=1 Tax=Polaribacter glomeratus TaxID=102 RepID=A0A2S7WHQ2_9FLAO|nr:hypothetical protein BTO16_14890 [Polaribacter glomeratus]
MGLTSFLNSSLNLKLPLERQINTIFILKKPIVQLVIIKSYLLFIKVTCVKLVSGNNICSFRDNSVLKYNFVRNPPCLWIFTPFKSFILSKLSDNSIALLTFLNLLL